MTDKLEKLVKSYEPRENIIMEIMKHLYAMMPYNEEIILANGRKGILKKFVEPRLNNDGQVEFGLDFKFSDNAYLELFVKQTGWGSPTLHSVPDEITPPITKGDEE